MINDLPKCAGRNQSDENDTGDDKGYSNHRCADCAIQDRARDDGDGLLTLVADWETVSDDEGCTISPEMLPVVITVKAATLEEAVEAASDTLQEHYGPAVPELYETQIERDFWFGLNDTDPYLRICAVFKGTPELVDTNGLWKVLRHAHQGLRAAAPAGKEQPA